MAPKEEFDIDLVKNYPQANKKITLDVMPYNLNNQLEGSSSKWQTTYISPFGIEFQGPKDYPDGTLLKINISLPDYWLRKQKYVEYSRVDEPSELKILAKVVKTEDVGKRGRKKLILVQTVNIDSVDEKVLKSYLHDAK